MKLDTTRARAKAHLRLLLEGAIARLPLRTVDGGVLLVRLDLIGDFILWQRSAVNFRALYPGRPIVLAANALWAPLASQLPYWDRVIPIDLSRLDSDRKYRIETFLSIRRQNFSVAIQPTFSRILVFGDSIVRASGARVRIGYDGDLSNMSAVEKQYSDRWYTELIAPDPSQPSEHERNDQFLRKLGCESIVSNSLPKVAVLSKTLCYDRPYFICFPGASWSGRRWPVERFAQLIKAVALRFPDWTSVICGSTSERTLCDELAGRVDTPCVTLAGKTTLAEFCEVVRGAELLVGNETSAVHIAAAVGTPSVCLLGGGHFGRFVPYPAASEVSQTEPVFEAMPCFGCNWQCHFQYEPGDPVPCIAAITLRAARDAIDRALAPTHGPRPPSV